MTTDIARNLRKQLVEEGGLRCEGRRDRYNVLKTSIQGVLQEATTARLANTANPSCFVNALRKECSDLHSAFGPISEEVRHRIDSLNEETILLRISHQPNTLCQLNITGLFIIANKLAMGISSRFNAKCQVVFICIDYDLAGDQRFRGPRIPGMEKLNVFSLNGAVPKNYRDVPAFRCPPIDRKTLVNWASSFRNSVSYWSRKFGETRYSKQDVASMVESQITNGLRGTSIAEQNIFHLMDIVLNHFAIPALFARASTLFASNAYPLGRLMELSDAEAHLKQYLDNSVWSLCDRCSVRSDCSLWSIESADNVCEKCNTRNAQSLDSRAHYSWEHQNDDSKKFAPKVILDDLLDFINMPRSIGVHYAGGIEHIHKSRSLACDLGFQLPPDLVWEPRGIVDLNYSSDSRLIREISSTDASLAGYDEVDEGFSKGKFPSVFFGMCLGYNFIASRVEQSLLI